MDSIYWADEKYPSTAFPSFFVIAAYFHVRLIPQNFGRLVSGSASEWKPQKELGEAERNLFQQPVSD